LFHRLVTRVGFGWSVRIIGFIALATLAVPIAVMKVRMLPERRRKLLDLDAFKEPAYTVYVASLFLGFTGYWVPFFYIELYALEYRITTTELAFYLLAIIAAGSIAGRFGAGVLSKTLGMFNVLIVCCISTSILCFCFIVAKSKGPLIVVTLLYGLLSGAIVSLGPAIAVALAPNRAVIGTRLGMAFFIVGIGMLIGSPIAGAVLRTYGFTATWSWAAAATMAAAVLLYISRGLRCGWGWGKML